MRPAQRTIPCRHSVITPPCRAAPLPLETANPHPSLAPPHREGHYLILLVFLARRARIRESNDLGTHSQAGVTQER